MTRFNLFRMYGYNHEIETSHNNLNAIKKN